MINPQLSPRFPALLLDRKSFTVNGSRAVKWLESANTSAFPQRRQLLLSVVCRVLRLLLAPHGTGHVSDTIAEAAVRIPGRIVWHCRVGGRDVIVAVIAVGLVMSVGRARWRARLQQSTDLIVNVVWRRQGRAVVIDDFALRRLGRRDAVTANVMDAVQLLLLLELKWIWSSLDNLHHAASLSTKTVNTNKNKCKNLKKNPIKKFFFLLNESLSVPANRFYMVPSLHALT